MDNFEICSLTGHFEHIELVVQPANLLLDLAGFFCSVWTLVALMFTALNFTRREVSTLTNSQVSKIINAYKNLSEEKRIIFLYRYFSLLITSIAYFISSNGHSIEKRVFIIGCIIIASIILNYLYLFSYSSKFTVKVLIFIETIGNSILLIPSGGLHSPNVWLTLNTVLITSLMLSRIYCWINIIMYLVSSIFISYLLFNDGERALIDIIYSESNIIVSFMLMVIATRLLSMYLISLKGERRKLLESNLQLVEANYTVKESISHIMELYQAVNLFSNTRNKNELIELILEHTKRTVETNRIGFFSYENQYKIICTALKEENRPALKKLETEIIKQWDCIVEKNSAVELYADNSCYLAISVKSNYMNYGILVVEVGSSKKNFNQIEKMDQIKFFADLSSIVLEKFELENVSDKLLITEEQNRIANEIHDSVLQRLYSTSFAIYGLMKKLNKANIKDVDADLGIIRESIDHAMKELRATIYGLSWNKNGSDNLITDIVNYINEVKAMHNIDVNLNIIGNSEFIAYMPKKAIYRIVCEGIGNSFRHGKASCIEVTLNIDSDVTKLRIVDDGVGFDMDAVRKSKQSGIGLKNIQSLIDSLNGTIDYQSTIGKGTLINIVIPNHLNDAREDIVV